MSKLPSVFTTNLYLAFCAFFMLTLPQSAHAQNKFDKLTDGNIRFFIEDLSKITAGNGPSMDAKRVSIFLNRHLHPNARFKSVLQYDIPGFPAQANSIALDKSEFIANVESGSQVLENYENDTHIVEIKISSDKKKATIQTQGYERGNINVEGEFLPVEGNSTCHQIIMLSKKGIIQMYNANCKTVISFQGGFGGGFGSGGGGAGSFELPY